MAAHNYSDTAVTTTLFANITAAATSMQVNSISGYPTAPYYLTLDRLTTAMEVVEVTGAATGTGPYTLPITRGVSNTTAVIHNAPATVEHVAPATFYTAAEASFAVMSPIGSIVMWATATPPTGWLICDGTTFSATTYPALNTLLGGNTLPNLQQRFPVGAGDNTGLTGTGASVLGVGGTTDNLSHSHTGVDHLHTIAHTHSFFSIDGGASAGTSTVKFAQGGGSTTTVTPGGATNQPSTGSSGGADRSLTTGTTGTVADATGMNVYQPYVALNFIIRAA